MAYGNRPRGRFSAGLQRFMMGRYGSDKLNMVLLCIGMALTIINLFVSNPGLGLGLMIGSYIFLGISVFRTFSRNIQKRYRENQQFLLFFKKLRDRQHRYYHCPRCRQQIRVPRGKRKISITCPKCKEKFIKKT